MITSISVNAQVDNQTSGLTRGTSTVGDLNGDGKVNVADVVTLVNLIMKDEGNSDDTVLGPTMVTGVVLQETLDCVFGTVNQPGFYTSYLAAYVGENMTGMPEFPISGPDYNVDPNGYYLRASELPTDENMFVGNSGKNAYLFNGTGNAGKLYFTINPRMIDPTRFNFSLINTTGEESPVKLSDVAKSDHLVIFVISSQSNGSTRNVEDDNTYLYEAKVTIGVDAIEKIHFDWTKFGYQNMWDAGAHLLYPAQTADAQADNMYGRYLYLMGMVKTKQLEIVLQASLKILQDFYNGVVGEQRTKKQKQALRISWDDGKNDVISGFDITSVVFNPLNYKQMALSEEVMPWSFENYEKTLSDLAKTIRENSSEVTSVTLKSVSMDGSQAKMTMTAGNSDVVINITEELYNAINNGMELSSFEQSVNAVLHPYQTLRNSGSGTMTRANSYLNKIAASAMREKGGNIALNGVEPILLFESAEGISQLHSNMIMNGDGATTFIMTSLTEEYIVPAYMKYIAVIQNGRVVEANTFEGKEKLVQLSLPVGESEIVYQVSDFYGNVITKRYAVNRKQ